MTKKQRKKRVRKNAQCSPPIAPSESTSPVVKGSLKFNSVTTVVAAIGFLTGLPGSQFFRSTKMFSLFTVSALALTCSFGYDFWRWQPSKLSLQRLRKLALFGTFVLGGAILLFGAVERYYQSVSPTAPNVLFTAYLSGKQNGGDYAFTAGQAIKFDAGVPYSDWKFEFQDDKKNTYAYEVGDFECYEQTLEELQKYKFIDTNQGKYRLTTKGRRFARLIAWRRNSKRSPYLYRYAVNDQGTIIEKSVFEQSPDNAVKIDGRVFLAPGQEPPLGTKRLPLPWENLDNVNEETIPLPPQGLISPPIRRVDPPTPPAEPSV